MIECRLITNFKGIWFYESQAKVVNVNHQPFCRASATVQINIECAIVSWCW